jgi:hypothetical protein
MSVGPRFLYICHAFLNAIRVFGLSLHCCCGFLPSGMWHLLSGCLLVDVWTFGLLRLKQYSFPKRRPPITNWCSATAHKNGNSSLCHDILKLYAVFIYLLNVMTVSITQDILVGQDVSVVDCTPVSLMTGFHYCDRCIACYCWYYKRN